MPPLPAPEPRRLAAVAATVGLALAGLFLAGAHLRLNPTASSAPAGLYRLRQAIPERGSLVVVCLPEDLGRWAKARGYLASGPCPGRARPVGKRLVALAGDSVEVAESGLAVNGRPLPGTARRRADSEGRPVPRLPEGTYPTAPGQGWLVSEWSPRSWDSRYFGAVPVGQEAYVLDPLVTWERQTER